MLIKPVGLNFGNSKKLSVSENKSLNKRAKVSVILPIYNQEKYVSKALDSLISQTLKDIEIICVNDGSKDNTLKILREYEAKDSRIKVIDQENQGTGRTRNNGVKAVTGEYIAFLDPDDWYDSNAMEELYNKSKEQDCDMVVFNFKRLNEKGEVLGQYNLKHRLRKLHELKETENFNWRDVKPRILGGIFPAAWNKFYKTDLVKKNNLRFANCHLAEDNVFVFGASLYAKNIGYSDKCYYNYLIHDKSAIHTKTNKNLAIFHSIDCVKKLIDKLGLADELKSEYDGYVFRFLSFLDF